MKQFNTLKKLSMTQRASPDFTFTSNYGDLNTTQQLQGKDNIPIQVVRANHEQSTYSNIPDKDQIEMMKLKNKINSNTIINGQIRRNTRHTSQEDDILYSTFNSNRFPSVGGYGSQTTRPGQKILAEHKTSAQTQRRDDKIFTSQQVDLAEVVN